MLRAPLSSLVTALVLAAGGGIATAPDGSRPEEPGSAWRRGEGVARAMDARPGPPRVLTAVVDGPITLGTAEYLETALARAEEDRFDALLVQLDTPGGDLQSTRTIVRGLLESKVPVLVWVGPAGARAGSAGVFITLAAHVAAMHPTSNIGAAHPVTGGGKDVEAEAGKDMAKKVENDTAAFVRTIAAARGRNAVWAERAVRESISATADEAVKERVVDFVAADREEALAKADGRTVRLGTADRVLHLRGATATAMEPTIRQRFLMFIADPNVVAILALLGLLGLGIEFYHPGAIFPGVAGAFCMFLVFVSSQVIPVNVAAVLLLIAGAGLLVSEAYFTSHGIAGAAGAVCLVVGMVFLLNTSAPGEGFDPGVLQVSPWVIWPTPVALALLFGFMGWKVARGRSAPLQVGAPGLVGEAGEALSDIGAADGEAFLHGEYWKARSATPIPRGARVRVVKVDGLVAIVEEDGPMR
jgi:membrane-bound serine protease (ClpP class)